MTGRKRRGASGEREFFRGSGTSDLLCELDQMIPHELRQWNTTSQCHTAQLLQRLRRERVEIKIYRDTVHFEANFT
jgi:hypothetical protein